ncbi:SMI1/KNR4 family protein [Burkholderia multivorans]|jgi:cell wall assembly regulator SMI1|uniref:SMI1/KNR4 family protein n=1 Tax=Burkholderia multivorans TaxID=87883 RepID=UPI001C270FCD|nr:SMI1/KNR4 family protein [Burkholderia multivorans]MBU9575927.1 SMI1/KNR4 family protein [Burkholderia multivorans]
MKQQWQRLEAWLKTHNPALLADLNPPASDADIQELEQKLGVKLPADFVECLKVHDGQRGGAEPLFDGFEFFSCSKIHQQWKIWTDLLKSGAFRSFKSDPDDGICPDWWCSAWIPFAGNFEGDCLCLDLGPEVGGSFGQVICVWHDDEDRDLISDGFSGFLKSLNA